MLMLQKDDDDDDDDDGGDDGDSEGCGAVLLLINHQSWRGGVCMGSVTTLLLAETKESERMDTSSKQQRTYEDPKRESGKRNGKSKEVETETGN